MANPSRTGMIVNCEILYILKKSNYKHMKALLSIMAIFAGFSAFAQTSQGKEAQLKLAVMAAPEDQQAEATVYGYTDAGEIVLLKQGSNELICLADNPAVEGLSVSAYHKSLQPFMARGWELKKQGKTFQEIFDIRESESKSGKLPLPDQGSLLNVLTAEKADVDWATGEVKNSYTRSVVYIPWATAEGTGLPLKPAGPGLPWIMDPGTHRAHIMINPAKD